MKSIGFKNGLVLLSIVLGLGAANAQPTKPSLTASPSEIPAIEQGALDIIQAMSTKLSKAKTLQFQVLVQSEAPSTDGITVIYTSNTSFAIQRPNKMAVVETGQGLPSELIYNGQSIVAVTPQTEVVAFSDAPGNIDEMAAFVYQKAGIYFPGGMILLSDPFANITGDLRAAFITETSNLVGGVQTDVVVLAGSGVEGQFWIGAEDKLPYQMTMIYTKEPNRPRVTLSFRDWQIDGPIPTDRFSIDRFANAIKVDFARIDAPLK